MRRIALVGLFMVAACAQQQAASAWQKPDGTLVGPREMRSAMLACDSEMGERAYPQQVPALSGQSGAWAHNNQAIQDSGAYGVTSSAELSACLHSYGYNRVEAPVGYGSSAPPRR